MISQTWWIFIFCTTNFDIIPFWGKIIKLRFYKIVYNSFFFIVTSMYVHFSCLNTRSEIWSRNELATEFQLNPSSINFLMFKRFYNVDFKRTMFVIIIKFVKIFNTCSFKLLHEQIKIYYVALITRLLIYKKRLILFFSESWIISMKNSQLNLL